MMEAEVQVAGRIILDLLKPKKLNRTLAGISKNEALAESLQPLSVFLCVSLCSGWPVAPFVVRVC